MTDHVDDLASAIGAEAKRQEPESFAYDNPVTGEIFLFDEGEHLSLTAIARAVLLHLRDAPSDRDFEALALAPDLPGHDIRAEWQAMFDRMLGK